MNSKKISIYLKIIVVAVVILCVDRILTFLFNFIPNIGSFAASLLPVLFAMIQFNNSVLVLWLAVCLIGIQFIFGNIIEPKIMGESINLSAVVILFALLFWGFVWGIPGMFLAVPMTVILKIVFENIDQLKPVAILMSGKIKT